MDSENVSSEGSALLAVFITSLMTSFAVTIPTRLPRFASTTGSACSLCFAIVSAATFIKSFVVTVTGSLVMISCTVCPKILLAVSESSISPNVTKLPVSSRGKKSNELTNPTRRTSSWSVSAFLRRSTTGAPDTPAWRSVAMASSTGVWGARVKRWGCEVMRSDTILVVDLVGVDMKTRGCLAEDEKDRQCPNVWRRSKSGRRVDIVIMAVM
mmetsp:Transcript_521/g.793  ORF Transcript_521/g.793 Transcript_521/m.793 type:complete len:212 (+) Transcript_521:249-884(+)